MLTFHTFNFTQLKIYSTSTHLAHTMISLTLNRTSIALIMIASLWSTIIISTELCPVPVSHNFNSQVHRRVARQAPLYSTSVSGDSVTPFNGRRLNRLPSGPPPQRGDFYGVGGRIPQDGSFSTPEHRLITDRNPSIVTVMENTVSRLLVPFTQLLSAPPSRASS